MPYVREQAEQTPQSVNISPKNGNAMIDGGRLRTCSKQMIRQQKQREFLPPISHLCLFMLLT